ncbi:hypothetical protein C0J52_09935 [Blattella germanica]|nr:hypothetical protein C0J52_09935 [Blattella germanica]
MLRSITLVFRKTSLVTTSSPDTFPRNKISISIGYVQCDMGPTTINFSSKLNMIIIWKQDKFFNCITKKFILSWIKLVSLVSKERTYYTNH